MVDPFGLVVVLMKGCEHVDLSIMIEVKVQSVPVTGDLFRIFPLLEFVGSPMMANRACWDGTFENSHVGIPSH